MATQSDSHSARGTLIAAASLSVAAGVGAGLYYYHYTAQKAKIESLNSPGNAKVQSLFIYPIKSCKGIAVTSAVVGPTGFLWDRWWMVVDENGRFITQRQEPKMALIETSIPQNVLLTNPKDLPPDAAMTLTAPGMDTLTVPLTLPAGGTAVDAKVWEWDGQALVEGEKAAYWFSSYLGRAARLVRFDLEHAVRPTDDTYAPKRQTAFTDGFPYLIISQASLEDLNAKADEPLALNRFRPSIYVEGCGAFEEDTWKTFTIGSESARVFHGVKPCGRCKVTTTNQETGDITEEPLKTLREFRSGEELCLPKVFKKEVIFGMNVVCDLKPTYFRKVDRVVSVGDVISVVEKSATIAELTPA